MTESDPTGVIISAVQQVGSGPFRALHASLPVARSKGPALEHFDVGGEGVSVYLLAQRPDDRYLFWQVEVWPTAEILAEDGWSATVKGEIDLDDADGEPRCVLNEQRTVASVEGRCDRDPGARSTRVRIPDL